MAEISKFSGDLDITIEQGSTWCPQLTWQDENNAAVDVTGYRARAQIRTSTGATTVIHEMTTENGGIVLGGVAGTIDLLISSVTTASFSFKRAVWDLEMIEPDKSVGGTSAADSNDAGTTLNDADALFVTNGVIIRDVLENVTDGSKAVVATVAEGVLTHTQLAGGALNTWTSGDVYRIIPKVRRLLEGSVTLDREVTK